MHAQEARGGDGQDGISLRIEATDPRNTGNYIRDIRVYQEKHADLIAMGERFDPEWFQQVDDYRVLRMHDWQGANSSRVTGWTENILTANQAFWVNDGRGMPYELLVRVANQARSDLWINMPHMATNDCMRQVAAYVKANLDKDLRVYVEYINEYWTDVFGQHQYLVDKGAALFGDAPFANAQAYGARAAEMTQIFRQVFGAEQARLHPAVTLTHNAFNTQEALLMLTTPAPALADRARVQDTQVHLAHARCPRQGSRDGEELDPREPRGGAARQPSRKRPGARHSPLGRQNPNRPPGRRPGTGSSRSRGKSCSSGSPGTRMSSCATSSDTDCKRPSSTHPENAKTR